MRELAARGVIAKQDLDDAVAAAESAQAAAKAAAANVESARINLGYATSPRRSRAARAGQCHRRRAGIGHRYHPLTTIEQIDPIYVNFTSPWRKSRRCGAPRNRATCSSPRRMRRGTGRAARQQRVSAPRHLELRRPRGGSGDRRGITARDRSQSRPHAAAGHVREIAHSSGCATTPSRCRRPRCSATSKALTCWSWARTITCRTSASPWTASAARNG